MWVLSTILIRFYNIISLNPYKVPYDIRIIIPILQWGSKAPRVSELLPKGLLLSIELAFESRSTNSKSFKLSITT